MNGGKVISHRVLYPRFDETVGKVSGVDWLFALDDVDPWVRTWRANSNVVFHASYVLQVISQRVDQALVPVKNFIIGNISLQAPRSPSNNFPKPMVDGFPNRIPSPAKGPDLAVPSDARELSGRVSPLMPQTCNYPVEIPSYMRSSIRAVTPSINPAQWDTPADPPMPHDTSGKLEHDSAFVSPLQAPLVLATAPTDSPCQDCPRIDLLALVREKQKVKKHQREKQTTLILREDSRRHEDPRGPKPERFSHLGRDARRARRESRKFAGTHTRQSRASKEIPVPALPVPQIFKPVLSSCVSVFDDGGNFGVDTQRLINNPPFVL